MIATKDIYIKVYDYIDPWGGGIDSLSWEIIASYHHTLGFTAGQDVFGRDILFNLTPIVDWRVLTARKDQKVDIDNVYKNTRRASH